MALTERDITKILDQAEAAANAEPSLVRVDAKGRRRTAKMHIVVVDRTGKIVGQRSMSDAWLGSIDIAKAKAFTAVAFSSDENALTTRAIGALSQPGQPLWQIGNSNRAEGIMDYPARPGELFEGMLSSEELEDVERALALFPAIIRELAVRLNSGTERPVHCSCGLAMERYRRSGRIGPDWRTWIKPPES